MSKMTQEERDRIPDEDFAGPHRSFPIRNQDDVEDAARLLHHADNPEKIKKNILKLIREKGLKEPETWEHEKTTHSSRS